MGYREGVCRSRFLMSEVLAINVAGLWQGA